MNEPSRTQPQPALLAAPQPLDRDDASRSDPDLFARLAEDPDALLLRLADDRFPVRRHRPGGPRRLRLERYLPLAVAPGSHGARGAAAIATDAAAPIELYLGRTLAPAPGIAVGTPVVARLEEAWPEDGRHDAEGAPGGELALLRELAAELPPLEHALATTALAMRNWHAAHPFSPASGDPLEVASAGWLRQDRAGVPSFPRTDAAIIAAVLDHAGERILLGANAKWARRRFSLLAGFVEPGESFEQAVEREIAEESGARIVAPRYVGSQPWPFPASIMVGFLADLDPGHDPDDLTPQPGEIDELRWFSRDDLVRDAHLLPDATTIAGRIIAGWARGDLA